MSGNDGPHQNWGYLRWEMFELLDQESKRGSHRLCWPCWEGGFQSSFFQPCSLHFFTNRLTSCERARVVTIRVSGMSTTIMSSTPNKATRRPDPGTMIPPATCSVRTVGSKNQTIGRYLSRSQSIPRLLSPKIRGWLASAGKSSAKEEKSPTSSQPVDRRVGWFWLRRLVIDLTKSSGDDGNPPSFGGGLGNGVVDWDLLQAIPNLIQYRLSLFFTHIPNVGNLLQAIV